MQNLINQLFQSGIINADQELLLDKIFFHNFTVTELGKEVNWDRRKVESVIEELSEIGILQPKQKYSRAIIIEEPRKIIQLLEYKRINIENTKQIWENSLDEIDKIWSSKNPEISRTFYGRNEFIRQFNLVLTENPKEIIHFGDEAGFVDLVGWDYYRQWIAKRVSLGIKAKDLAFSFDGYQKIKNLDEKEKREIKIIPNSKASKGSLFVYNNKIIYWDTSIPKLTVVEDIIFATLLKSLFEIAWSNS